MATEFGKRGGTSATAGKRGEVLRSPSTGMTKRVFKGQRWLVVQQRDENDKCFLSAFNNEETAKRCSDGAHRLGYEVHYIERAEVTA